jgi:hypothetical protein
MYWTYKDWAAKLEQVSFQNQLSKGLSSPIENKNFKSKALQPASESQEIYR